MAESKTYRRTIRELVQRMESFAPPSIQESYDNCGLIVGNRLWEITGVLTTLDVTMETLLEAKEKGCNLIVAHHPIVFFGLKSLVWQKGFVEQIVMQAIKWDIAILASHTSLDKVYKGVSKMFLDKLGLQQQRFLKDEGTIQPENGYVPRRYGLGMIGTYEEAMPFEDFIAHVKETLDCKVIKHTGQIKSTVQTVAVCGGAGASLLKNAISEKVDVYITADITYHQWFDAQGKVCLMDIGHYESESYVAQGIRDRIVDHMGYRNDFPVYVTSKNTNPVIYYT